METIIFGGSFNPPTNSHEAITRACLGLPNVNEVWLMPSAERFDKSYDVRDEDRYEMLEIMHDEVFNKDERLRISNFEFKLSRPTQTCRTVVALNSSYPESNFRFVFGADSLQNMSSWQDGERLQKTLGMLIVPRGEIAIPKAPTVTTLNVPVYENTSSTEVRSSVAKKLPIDRMVCRSVANYINKYGLYQVK